MHKHLNIFAADSEGEPTCLWFVKGLKGAAATKLQHVHSLARDLRVLLLHAAAAADKSPLSSPTPLHLLPSSQKAPKKRYIYSNPTQESDPLKHANNTKPTNETLNTASYNYTYLQNTQHYAHIYI